MTIIDYTTATPASTLKNAGVTDVIRYLSWNQTNTDWKRITSSEYQNLVKSGINVVLNWEYDARDFLLGASGGRAHATEAVKQAKQLGYDQGRVIYFSCDFDAQSGDRVIVQAYCNAAKPIVEGAGYFFGIYGPWNVLEWNKGSKIGLWQAGMSSSWSGGKNSTVHPAALIFQQRQANIAGMTVDVNVKLKDGWDAMTVQLDLDQVIFTDPVTNEVKRMRDFINDTHRILLKGLTKSSDGSNAYMVQQFRSLNASNDNVSQNLEEIKAALANVGGGVISDADRTLIANFTSAVSALTEHLR